MRSATLLLLVITFASLAVQDRILSCKTQKFALTPNSIMSNPDTVKFNSPAMQDVIPNVCALTSDGPTVQALMTPHTHLYRKRSVRLSNLLLFCDECEQCPDRIPYVVDYLTKYSAERHLIVVVVPQYLLRENDKLSNEYVKLGYSVPHALIDLTTPDVCSMRAISRRSFSRASVHYISIVIFVLMSMCFCCMLLYCIRGQSLDSHQEL